MASSNDNYPDTEQILRREPDLTGRTVGEYEILDKLGEGGFGTVYRAIHPMIGKEAAVKVLNRELSSDLDMVSRFVSEARAVNTIRHPNILDIFNFGTLEDGRCYFIMELLDGTSFETFLEQHTRADPPLLCEIMLGVAMALDAAHDKGIVHRDLKPDNIFLHHTPGGQAVPKLLDFGIAKLLGDSKKLGKHRTHTGAPLGTPAYMSPEQCLARDVDSRSDVYSFGVVCFEGLTGKAPFDAPSLLELMNLHALAPRPRASEAHAAVHPAFDAVLQRLMAIHPQNRPASIMDAYGLLAEAARRAGYEVPSHEPAASHSGRYRAASTGSSRAFMPTATPSAGTPDSATHLMLGDEATVEATVEATTGLLPTQVETKAVTLGATARNTQATRPKRRRPVVWVAAGGVALAIAAAAFVLSRTPETPVVASDTEESVTTATHAASAAPAAPEPAPPPVTSSAASSAPGVASADATASAAPSVVRRRRAPPPPRSEPKPEPAPKEDDPFSYQ